MPNPSGKSDMNFPVPYGGVKERTQLLKAAPVSGAPIAGSALNTARRSQRRAAAPSRPRPPAPEAQAPAPVAAAPAPPSGEEYKRQVALAWQDAAQVPGASDTVQMLAAQAMREAESG